MARRDLRRHRGRSLVVLLMVGLPTMLICAGLVLAATSQISDAELAPRMMGPAAASVQTPEPDAVMQRANPSSRMTDPGTEARRIPGHDPEADVRANVGAIGDLTDSEAVPWGEGSARAHVDDRLLRLDTLVLPGADRFPGKVDLVSGRWPAADDEVLVSPSAVERGVPGSGALTLSTADGEGTQTVTVVGTATALGEWSQYELVARTPDVVTAGSDGGWLLLREEPVGWQEVRRLNTYGLAVASADVLRDPPATSELHPQIAMDVAHTNRADLTTVVLSGTLLLTITLLVGPAFAVGAVRQRRTLALTASNGATSQQLRRTVLAQALVLGGLSALLGAVLSLPLAWATTVVLRDQNTMGPFDVPWLQLAGIVVIALVAAIIAALVPALRLTRLDIISAMRGRVTSAPPSRLLLLLGVVIAVAGGAVILLGTVRGADPFALAGGAVALIGGTLLIVPTILHLLGRLAGALPLPLRLATRDLSRHRARSAPTVAAVLAGTAALTIGLMGATSDDEQRRQQYVPSTLPGEAVLYVEGSEDAAIATDRAAVEGVAPQLVTTPLSNVTPQVSMDPPADEYWEDFVVSLSSECTVDGAVLEPPDNPSCQVVGGPMSNQQMATLPADEIVRRFDLTGSDADAVRSGAGVLLASPHTDHLVDDGSVTTTRGQVLIDSEFYEATDTRRTTTSMLPVITRPVSKDALGRSVGYSLVVPSATADERGWPAQTSSLLLHDPDGPISRETVERINAARGGTGWVELEQGYQNPLGGITAALLGIFTLLLLVVTLTSTALSLAEQSRDQATLAAVGAGRRTRRLMAGAQTLVLALVGVLLGVAVGAVPGIAIAMQLTSQGWDPVTGDMLTQDATIVIPWLALAVMTVAVPLLAGALAAAGIRRAPDATHREQ